MSAHKLVVHDYDQRMHKDDTKSVEGRCAWGGGCERSAAYSAEVVEHGVTSTWAVCEHHAGPMGANYQDKSWLASSPSPW